MLETPVATIGIRGTTIAGVIAGDGEKNSISLLADADGQVGDLRGSERIGRCTSSQAALHGAQSAVSHAHAAGSGLL